METKTSEKDKMFLLVKGENEKVMIAVGNNVVSTKRFDTYEQAEKYIGTKPYEIIFNTCYCIIQNFIKNENKEIKNENPQKK